jgi:hypothetical protein
MSLTVLGHEHHRAGSAHLLLPIAPRRLPPFAIVDVVRSGIALFAFAQSPAHPAAEGRVRSVGEFMTCLHTEVRNDYELRPQAAYPP